MRQSLCAAVSNGLVLAASATRQVMAVNGRIAYIACDCKSTIEFTICDIWTKNADGSASELPCRRRIGD